MIDLLDAKSFVSLSGALYLVCLLLLLPETEVSMAVMVAEKWLTTVRQATVNIDGVDIHFTCSIGVSSLTNEDRFDVLLQKVEANIQQAKATGGNKIVSTA